LGVLIRRLLVVSVVALAVAAGAIPASAQRLPFNRTIDVMPGATLDVTTVRGKISVMVHDARQVRIEGAVTIRPSAGFTSAGDPMVLARRVADSAPIEVAGNVVRLRPPADSDALRALTVSYDVWVPRDSKLVVSTDSGEVNVDGVAGPVTVHTGSSTITLSRLTGKTEVKTESGEVKVDRATGGLSVVTESSAITLRQLAGPLDVRTQSGAVRASFADAGAADVETGSSAVELEGLSGRVTVRTQSGRVGVRGAPTADWNVTTGSSVIEAAFEPAAKFRLEATSSTSNVRVNGLSVDGPAAEKGRVSGTVGGGGPTVRLASRSGQIHIGH
jgi:DUF4097 and DUF4098 domain-containing protein YvlB